MTARDSGSVVNVLLITIDSLRADHVFPEDGLGTESIVQLQEDGVAFDRAFATGPGTSPSFPGILTGTMPLSYSGLGPLSNERPKLASHLRDAGLATGGFQCNPFLSAHFNYDEGFDTFEDYQNPLMGIATKIFPRGIEISNPRLRRIDDLLHLTDGIKKAYQLIKGKPRPYVSAEVITDDTIEWLSSIDDPFFCWTHYMDVHHPCFPPADYRERHDVADATQSEVSEWYSALLRAPDTLSSGEIESLRRLYKAAIDYTDDQVGRILDHLKETGRYENTLIICTSDHGELFGEHGEYGKPERMYDELLHIPLVVVNGPDYLQEVNDDLVSLLDLPPLIHAALGFDVPEVYEGQVPGVNPSRDHIMAEHMVEGEVIVGARSKDWLYEGDEIRSEHRLFNLRDGTFEQVSIGHYPDVESLRTTVLNRLDELNVETYSLNDSVEGDVESRLEDLGYL